MARTSDPHSANSQFYINLADNSFLDFPGSDTWGYTVFGKVTEGMEVVDKIKVIPTGSGGPFSTDVPQSTVIVEKAVLVQ
jgi:peptidyl-prolyl cis-trans isomerase B (cyclophilin B)